jgi:hypothetical protein
LQKVQTSERKKQGELPILLISQVFVEKTPKNAKKVQKMLPISVSTLLKRLATIPSSAGMSLTKLTLGGNHLIIPASGEFGKWHPGWDESVAKLFFTVYLYPVQILSQFTSFSRWRGWWQRRPAGTKTVSGQQPYGF